VQNKKNIFTPCHRCCFWSFNCSNRDSTFLQRITNAFYESREKIKKHSFEVSLKHYQSKSKESFVHVSMLIKLGRRFKKKLNVPLKMSNFDLKVIIFVSTYFFILNYVEPNMLASNKFINQHFN
jgi:hypothetical protein